MRLRVFIKERFSTKINLQNFLLKLLRNSLFFYLLKIKIKIKMEDEIKQQTSEKQFKKNHYNAIHSILSFSLRIVNCTFCIVKILIINP